ncbi:MAG: ABC transporter ATP-binding protein [Planctomycetota bacterium]|jgi:oligopeptide/dipeptide ABC transporter ATP-binding protein|nr:ABC transporter ATP-binding protein [Planctomycetota bacterium]
MLSAEAPVARPNVLARLEGVRKYFGAGGSWLGGCEAVVKAVDDVSFAIPERRIVGLVGESGSGKTTVGRLMVKLLEPTGGNIRYRGRDIAGLAGRDLRDYRGRVQMIFQDPFSSLNPRLRVEAIVGEALLGSGIRSAADRRGRVVERLEMVGLDAGHLRRYPHEFSGGQRQRIGIARALAADPEFIVADEPVSALDVSVQAQVLNLLLELQERLGLAILFITHDLAVMRFLCDEVAVMYLGRIMETGKTREVMEGPRHPYTRALLSAVPSIRPGAAGKRIILDGDIPSPIAIPSGCVFRTRCPEAKQPCAETSPPLAEKSPGHFSACLFG